MSIKRWALGVIGLLWMSSLSAATRSIPPQSLQSALLSLASDTGIQLVFVSEIAAGQKTLGAPAGLSADQALRTLLSNTGLSYRWVNAETVMIESAPLPARRVARRPEPVGPSAAELEEVTVTAERRSESAQQLPISLAVVQGDTLSQRAYQDVSQALQPQVGVVMQGMIGRYTGAIRGLGTNTPPNQGETAVAVNFDGVYNDMLVNTSANLFDLERIEVLRGPQGTLYGRNAAAGAINLISRDPQSEFAVSGAYEAGNYDLQNLQGVLNAPVNDSNSVRLALNFQRHDGYLSNNQNDQDTRAVRLKWLYQPDESLRLLLATVLDDMRGSTGSVPAFISQPDNPWYSDASDQNFSKAKAQLWYAKLDWSTPVGTLTALPAYQYRNISQNFVLSNGARNTTGSWLRQSSLETRLASSADSPAEWLTGLYHYRAEGLLRPPQGPSEYGLSSTAVFAQLTQPVAERWAWMAGLRATHDNKYRKAATYYFDQSWNNLDYKTGVTYQWREQAMAYMTVATGYRPGGVYQMANGQFDHFQPEHVVSFEIGAKTRWRDGALQLNADAFYYNYTDFQATGLRVINGVLVNGYQNAPGALISGSEMELSWLAGNRNRLDVSLAYLDTRFKQGFVNNGVDYSGGELENAPHLSTHVGYEHLWEAVSGQWVLSLDWYSKTSYYLSYVRQALSHQPAYNQEDIALSYHHGDGHWSASAWMHNIGNYAVRSSYITVPSGDAVTLNPPRTYGISVTYDY